MSLLGKRTKTSLDDDHTEERELIANGTNLPRAKKTFKQNIGLEGSVYSLEARQMIELEKTLIRTPDSYRITFPVTDSKKQTLTFKAGVIYEELEGLSCELLVSVIHGDKIANVQQDKNSSVCLVKEDGEQVDTINSLEELFMRSSATIIICNGRGKVSLIRDQIMSLDHELSVIDAKEVYQLKNRNFWEIINADIIIIGGSIAIDRDTWSFCCDSGLGSERLSEKLRDHLLGNKQKSPTSINETESLLRDTNINGFSYFMFKRVILVGHKLVWYKNLDLIVRTKAYSKWVVIRQQLSRISSPQRISLFFALSGVTSVIQKVMRMCKKVSSEKSTESLTEFVEKSLLVQANIKRVNPAYTKEIVTVPLSPEERLMEEYWKLFGSMPPELYSFETHSYPGNSNCSSSNLRIDVVAKRMASSLSIACASIAPTLKQLDYLVERIFSKIRDLMKEITRLLQIACDHIVNLQAYDGESKYEHVIILNDKSTERILGEIQGDYLYISDSKFQRLPLRIKKFESFVELNELYAILDLINSDKTMTHNTLLEWLMGLVSQPLTGETSEYTKIRASRYHSELLAVFGKSKQSIAWARNGPLCKLFAMQDILQFEPIIVSLVKVLGDKHDIFGSITFIIALYRYFWTFSKKGEHVLSHESLVNRIQVLQSIFMKNSRETLLFFSGNSNAKSDADILCVCCENLCQLGVYLLYCGHVCCEYCAHRNRVNTGNTSPGEYHSLPIICGKCNILSPLSGCFANRSRTFLSDFYGTANQTLPSPSKSFESLLLPLRSSITISPPPRKIRETRSHTDIEIDSLSLGETNPFVNDSDSKALAVVQLLLRHIGEKIVIFTRNAEMPRIIAEKAKRCNIKVGYCWVILEKLVSEIAEFNNKSINNNRKSKKSGPLNVIALSSEIKTRNQRLKAPRVLIFTFKSTENQEQELLNFVDPDPCGEPLLLYNIFSMDRESKVPDSELATGKD